MRVVIFFILSVMLFGCSTAENEVFILPKEYRGYVLIIFNQKNGVPSKYNGEKRVYEIPQNGILKTQFKLNDGLSDFPQFYYEKPIQSNRILFKTEFKNVPIDTVVAFGGTSGSIKKSAESEDRILIVKFYIGTKSDIDQAREQAEKLDIVKLAVQ